MKSITIILSAGLLICSCSSDQGSDPATLNTSGITPDPYAPIAFDTTVLKKKIELEIKKFDDSSSGFLKLEVNRSGHEWYSKEYWYFNKTCELQYFKGEWGSESLGGEFFFSFREDSLICGFEHNDNHMAYDEFFGFYKFMTPNCGYRTYSEIIYTPASGNSVKFDYKPLPIAELRKKETQLLDFLKKNKSALNAKFSEMIKKDGSYYLEIVSQERVSDEYTAESKEEFYIDSLLYHCVPKPD